MVYENSSLRIVVDADACPVKKSIIKIARERDIPVVMVCDTSHEIRDEYSTVIKVDKAKDSVDIALINFVKKGDIVVTQDYGVAAMALGKGIKVLNQNGLVYSDDNMDSLLFERHLGQKVRRAGGKSGNLRKRSPEDDEKFENALLDLIKEAAE